MYQVFCDNVKLYDSRYDTLKIFNAKLELELNKTGSFNFDIYPEHPRFNNIYKMKSVIEVYQDDYLIFKGRVLNDEQGFYNEKQIVCEGELAFLIDSVMRPYGSQEEPFNDTPEAYLRKLIDNHNSQVDEGKRFTVRTVDVPSGTDTGKITRYDTDYKTTWELISEKLVNSLGGYLWVSHENGITYLDYLEDFNVLSNQKIEFGKNLLNISKTTKGEDVASAIIPIGGSGEGETKITIGDPTDTTETVIEGTDNDIWKKGDYIYSKKAVAEYGWVFKAVTWSDVETDVDYLQKQAVKYLSDAINMATTIELTAADLATIENVNPFRLGRYITIKSKYHGLESSNDFLIKKLSLDILQPANNKLIVGTTYSTFTETANKNVKEQAQIAEKIGEVEKKISGDMVTPQQLAEVVEQNSTSISQSSTEILSQVSQDYYLKDDADKLVESVNTQFKQTNDEFELRFNEFNQDIQAVATGADAQFQQISKYIRFVDGNIILGEEGNELTLKIQNDRISFLEGNVEVAYFSNRKLYVNDGEYINSLKLGNYAFIPRPNGNISFKKVT